VPSVAGIVIAGGRSARFGGEVAAAALAGEALLVRAARRLQRSCAFVAVNARAGTEAESICRGEGLPVVHGARCDPPGPLAGVRAGLLWAKEQGAWALAVSPSDAPLLPEDLFARLVKAARSGPVMAETSQGHESLCAVWPVSALEAVTRALTIGAYPTTWLLLQHLRAIRIPFSFPEKFVHVRTREDLSNIARLLELEAFERARDRRGADSPVPGRSRAR